MNTRATRATFAALTLLLTGAAAAQEMPWAKSFDDARATAAKEHKLVMVDFYTDW